MHNGNQQGRPCQGQKGTDRAGTVKILNMVVEPKQRKCDLSPMRTTRSLRRGKDPPCTTGEQVTTPPSEDSELLRLQTV